MATKYSTQFYPKDSYEGRMIANNQSIEFNKNRAAIAKSRGNKDEASAANAMANMKEIDNETILQRMNPINSRAQYEHERDAGDPNALKLSFDEWKKL